MKLILAATIGIAFSCLLSLQAAGQDIKVTPVDKVNWEKLNPARGDKSPQAATLWGDRKGDPATGFLVKFVDGFSSPPHIHNVSYRGIVIEGLVHNDDPQAAPMWMPATSYWTQPAGESHITSAKGKTNIAFIEIDNGPYLVKPEKEAFANGQFPYNIHASNIIWMKQATSELVETWQNGKGQVTGRMYRFKQRLILNTEDAKIVVIQGAVNLAKQALKPGSWLDVGKKSKVEFTCASKPCVVYINKTETRR